jgi:hypothetical protein
MLKYIDISISNSSARLKTLPNVPFQEIITEGNNQNREEEEIDRLVL